MLVSGPAPDQARSFFERYAAAFARYDAVALVELFAFPLHIVGIVDMPTAISIPSRDDWLPLLDGLLGSYRRLGVAGGVPLELQVSELTGRACSVRLHWELRRDDGSAIYDFTAIYTLAQVDRAWRVFAIVHDELPKLNAALGR
jgi:hypothetical protein